MGFKRSFTNHLFHLFTGGETMKRKFYFKAFVYFLCLSFLLLANGFHGMIAEAREVSRPIGEMVSRGEVKFESRENVWKKVEASNFPIFQGVKVKTEKGEAIVKLTYETQIEIGPHGLLSFDQSDRVTLFKGKIGFRIKPDAEINIKIGNLSITPSKPLQASKGLPILPLIKEEAIGSLFVHESGSVTLKSLQGSLSILDQDRVVIAALSSRDSVTIPSITVKGVPKVMVAQAGETGAKGRDDEKGFPWLWALAGAAGLGGVIAGISFATKDGGDHDYYPICFP